MIDFVKATVNSENDAIKVATKKFTKRGIIAVIIFLLPNLITLILNIAGISGGTCGIS